MSLLAPNAIRRGLMVGAIAAVLFIHDKFTGSLDLDISGRIPDTVNNGNSWSKENTTGDTIGVSAGYAFFRQVNSSAAIYALDTAESDVLVDTIVWQKAVGSVSDVWLAVRLELGAGFFNNVVYAVSETDTNLLILGEYVGGGQATVQSVAFNPPVLTQYKMTLQVIGTDAIATAQGGVAIASGVITSTPYKGVGMILRGNVGGVEETRCYDFKVFIPVTP